MGLGIGLVISQNGKPQMLCTAAGFFIYLSAMQILPELDPYTTEKEYVKSLQKIRGRKIEIDFFSKLSDWWKNWRKEKMGV